MLRGEALREDGRRVRLDALELAEARPGDPHLSCLMDALRRLASRVYSCVPADQCGWYFFAPMLQRLRLDATNALDAAPCLSIASVLQPLARFMRPCTVTSTS